MKNLHYKIQSLWYKKSPLRFLLWPFSLIFMAILTIRKFLYRIGLKKTVVFDCPVIVIGNITVGGTGKTPVVIALAAFLKSKGYAPGIVSRGYKGKCRLPELVNAGSDPNHVGDEAVLLAKRTGCPVVVCPNRVAAVTWLLKHESCDIVLSDDGLQHLALGRDFEIVVIDGQRLFGNGFLLPAGPLREPKKRLKTVQCCVINNGSKVNSFFLKPTFLMSLEPGSCVNLKTGKTLTQEVFKEQSNKNLYVCAGIGNPDRFFQMLRSKGFVFQEHAFPDHYCFQQTDFHFLKANAWVLMTEKDAVKCRAFADERYWYLPVDAKLPEAFFELIPYKNKKN